MDLEKSSFNSRDIESAKRDLQLRVYPTELRFVDAVAGKVYRLSVTLHNVGRSNQKIRFQEPSKPQFKLVMSTLDKALASGLQLTAVVEYHPDKDEDNHDELVIYIGSKTLTIPLIGLIPTCQWQVEQVIDFGKLVANSKVYCKEVNVFNHGKAPGTFLAEYLGHLPIVISPTNGTVMPKSSMVFKVDLCTSKAQVVNEVVRMSLQGQPDIHLNIKAHVVNQVIEVLNINTGKKIKCIDFSFVYFGTSKLEYAYLHNDSPEAVTWVAILQDDTVGEEVATNIRQRTDVVLNNLSYLSKIRNIDVSNFITCIPNEGKLQPYEKVQLTFCFSPKLLTDDTKNFDPAHRQDYALFLRFECVGSRDGYLRNDINKEIKSDQYNRVELALTGTGLPVLLQFIPGKVFTFQPCLIGGHSDMICTMHNHSRSLPVSYQFKKAAHFKINPKKGKIDEGCNQVVTCSFIPHQIGIFKVKQIIEIIGLVANEDFQSTTLKPFHEMNLYFNSVCKPSTTEVVMAINPGLSPLVSNPTVRYVTKDVVNRKESTRAAMLQSALTPIHDHRSAKEYSAKDALIAFPNDRAASIRPGDHKNFRTIFTKIPRYSYVDPEFEYTDLEKLEKGLHKNYYARYINYLRNMRIQKQAEREFIRSHSITEREIPPDSGVKSPEHLGAEVPEESQLIDLWPKPNQMLTTKNIIAKVTKSLKRKIIQGIKSEPSTPTEKHHCSIVLTPKQIHQVIIGPSVLNFGDVCVHSINSQVINIINMLSVHVLIEFDIQFKELEKSKQFSFVIPPIACTYISMIFHTTTVGKFWKSFTFKLNGKPTGHILVMAVVHPVRLELSYNDIVLKPQGFLMKSCFRKTVSLYNPNNYFAQFEWEPVKKKGMAFSVNPVKGIVEPHSSLECEVTWNPGFSSLEKGEIILHVPEGNTTKLKCTAEPGQSKVMYLEPRVIFSHAPQGLTSWRTAVLHNVGPNHAYYRICDEGLSPIIKIVPAEGIIPFGGLSVINVSCTPSEAGNFDTKAKISIHGANIITLRIGGTVDIAEVEIEPSVLKFIGTYVDSTNIFPISIINKGVTRARVSFNMEEHREFSVHFADKSVKIFDPESPHVYFLELDGKTTLECGIAFAPKEVAVHKFQLHVLVNNFNASELYCQHLLEKTPLTLKKRPLIKPFFIQATALQAPLTFSKSVIVFEIPLHDLESENNSKRSEDLVINNVSKKTVQWTFSKSQTSNLFMDPVFKFSKVNGVLLPGEECKVTIDFQPTCDKEYIVDIPVLLNDNPVCYRTLKMIGEVKSPKLSFDPPHVFFTPVPLDVRIALDIVISPKNHFKNASVRVSVPKVKGPDGEELRPISVRFPNGSLIQGSPSGINSPLTCRLAFKSSKSVSLFLNVRFSSMAHRWFSLPVSATAENCILTIYPYMALHIDEQKIVLKDDESASVLNADLSLLCNDEFISPEPSKCVVSVPTTGRKLSVGIEVTYERNKFLRRQSVKSDHDGTMETEEENKQFFFPDEGTKAYTFFHKIVNAAQTWFSLFGWPGGPHSLSIPETVRRDLYKLQICSSASSGNYSCQDNFSKFNKTIYDVIIHLSGIVPPGINSDQSLPVDRVERVIQLYSQHSSLLKFLKAHGAYISHVLPEFLFEPDDYSLWIKLMSSSDSNSENCLVSRETLSIFVDKEKFEVWSKRAWTDVFLQIYKIMVLSRIVPHKSKDLPQISVKSSPKLNPCFISSNMYSNPERLLLSWLNTNYENARQIIWKNCLRGVAPSERWIINFDTDLSDGLVLGTQFGAYCPFLIDSHLVNMYTHPKSPEQYLHNCLIIVNVLHEIGFEMDIQATDICDPNPIMMLMLCAYMYERLPTYLPKKMVLFNCSLHDTAVRQILIKNPSMSQLVYTAMIVGRDAADFSLTQKGDTFVVAPRGQVDVNVEFTSRFLHPAEALLLLVSKTKHAEGGSTLTFALKGELLQFKSVDIIKCISPCYTWKEVTVTIKNPFRSAGEFRVILLESSTFISMPSQLLESKQLLNRMEESSLFLEPSEDHTSCDRDVSEGCVPSASSLKTSIKCNFVREFFCSETTFNLSLKGSSLKLFFLPFAMHLRYCIIILSSRKIGEIVYILEGRGIIPLPSYFPSMMSSFQTDHKDRKDTKDEALSKKDPVLYLKCKLGEVLCTNLNFPLINDAKEKAFAFAAQRQMSKMEYDRREITGTLESSSVRVAVALLGLTKLECRTFFTTSQFKRPKTILYTVEISLPEFFHVPDKIYIPQIPESRTKHSELHGMKLEHKSEPDASIAVPLRFLPLESGRYPCKILLKSKYDVRFYLIEGVVDEQWVEGRFEFRTRAFKAITQHIPIANTTNKEWKCRAEIEGDWFYGPPVIYIGPNKKTSYPLTFKPILECEILGKLTLVNVADAMKHIFEIRGIGKPPLAIENIVVDCPVGIDTRRTIMVPNHTKSILTYKVTSDLSIVWGNPAITVQPDNIVPYILHINPWKRGQYKGMITFTVLNKQEIDLREQPRPKPRKDSVLRRERRRASVYRRRVSLIPAVFNKKATDDSLKNLRVWFCIDINSIPGLPVDIFEIKGTALEPVFVEIPLHNTQDKILHIEVLLSSPALSGMKEIDLSPEENRNYSFQISTAVTGSCEEKIIFQPETSFEFWYLLKLTIDLPKPTTISELQCELGKYISQNITLNNPTYQVLELKGISTNPVNFILQLPDEPLVIPPFSSKEISFHYYPSALGKTNQQGSIIFSCSQFEEWVFNVSGMGLYPISLNIERISTYIRLPKCVVIPFQNPTMEEVIVDITLTNEEKPENFIIDDFWNDFFERTSVFILSDDLPTPHEIRLPPRGKLSIPVFFIPDIMRLYKTIVIIQMKRVNGELWPIDHLDELNVDLKQIISIFNEKVPIIHWLYPIIGLPEARNPTYPLAVITCKAKTRIEEIVEVIVKGDFFSRNPIFEPKDFLVIPKKTIGDSYGDLFGDKEVREFEYEIEFESEEKKKLLESCVAAYMLDKSYNVDTEEITLIFSLVFAPKKPLRSKVSLTIQCSSDGIWRFPLLLVAKQPNPDGIINIEGVGLNKDSYLEFYLTTASRDPEPFTACFRPKSDPEFFITPQEGELRPHESERSIFRVGFKPQRYGKPYKAELVIETEDMYWLYAVYGVIPTSAPSKDVKAKVDCHRMSESKTKCVHNYVYENARLFKTGLSPKTKNAPLTWKNK